MYTAQEFLLADRRQIIRIVSGGVAIMTSGTGVILLALMLFLPDRGTLAIYATMLGSVFLGNLATFLLLSRIEVGRALLPMVLTIIGSAIFSSIVLRETALLSGVALVVVVILISLGRSRTATSMLSVACIVLAVIIAGTAPVPVLTPDQLSLGSVLPLINMVSVGTLITVVWLIMRRLLSISDQAVGLAEQRASEADQARAEIEQRAVELAEKNETQERLLSLVAVLETPTVVLADDTVLLPLIGHIDTRRATELTSRLLETVHQENVRYVIVDVTGIAMLDTGVVQGLLRTVQAVRLLGARAILCGVQAHMATSLVQLGVELTGVDTVRNPQEALELIAEARARNGVAANAAWLNGMHLGGRVSGQGVLTPG